jgi:hypothetical protein
MGGWRQPPKITTGEWKVVGTKMKWKGTTPDKMKGVASKELRRRDYLVSRAYEQVASCSSVMCSAKPAISFVQRLWRACTTARGG